MAFLIQTELPERPTAALRYEPCTQFINVSQRTLHIYFIDGCRRIKIERNNLLCEQAPTEVFRSIFAWLVTFNLFRVLHDIFILHKVIDQRYHGEDQCDPHNDIGKDLQLREVGDHQADHDHLEGGLELAPVTCGNDYAIVGSDQTEAADDKLSGDDDDDHPGRDTVHLDQCDHGGTY